MKKIKVVTIGGGSSYTPELVEGLIERHKEFPVAEYWLCDIEAGREKLEIITALAKRMVKKSGVDMKIFSTLDRREALKDADFVTTQIRVGLLEARERDERIPLSHGMLGQETNGAAGMMKAFRTIPVLLDIAKDIEELCPDAWIINFTNPSGMVTEAVLKYTNITKIISLCNVPIGVRKKIISNLGAEENQVTTKFAGLNHMIFCLEVDWNGKNVTQDVIEKMISTEQDNTVQNIESKIYEPDFLRALGVIPCPYHQYYYKRDIMLKEQLEQFKQNGVRATVVKKLEKELFEQYKDENLDIKPSQLSKRGGSYYSECACNLMTSIYNDKKDIHVVGTLNNGAIEGFENNTVVEISSVITKNGPIPLAVGKLPSSINGLVQQIKSFELAVIDAAITGSREKALLALTINPLTHSDRLAKIVLDEMLEANKEFLPQFFK